MFPRSLSGVETNGIELPIPGFIPPTPRSHINRNGQYHDDDVGDTPYSTKLIDDHTIPKHSDRQKDKAQHGPKEGAEYTVKPVGENPQDRDQNPGEKKSDEGKGARHGGRFWF